MPWASVTAILCNAENVADMGAEWGAFDDDDEEGRSMMYSKVSIIFS
jgi:hypothetical protein